ncbi:unnamed protein product [Rangifer tarandus platyrhynchus]|uniref:Uncharacterized protein n=2 Tax=Rangifer tarandus platyrhynchus TaxID=3082113 RepID=A0ABN8Y6M5_RANTA|nr:unnamed protein product [Rangifer tarandus platyrhynchus]CAI9693248.1 unnamed protein product [Rangifer tarandus platyrhynchus]
MGFLVCAAIIHFSSNTWFCRFDRQKITDLTPLHNNFGAGVLGSVDLFPHLRPLRTKLFPLTSPPAARSAALGRNPEFPRTLPGKGVGRGGCTPGDESGARPGSGTGAGGEGGEKALAGSPSAENLARRLLLAFPGPAAEEPWDQGSAL